MSHSLTWWSGNKSKGKTLGEHYTKWVNSIEAASPNIWNMRYLWERCNQGCHPWLPFVLYFIYLAMFGTDDHGSNIRTFLLVASAILSQFPLISPVAPFQALLFPVSSTAPIKCSFLDPHTLLHQVLWFSMLSSCNGTKTSLSIPDSTK